MKAKRRALITLFITVLLGGVGVLGALLWKPLRIQLRLHELRSAGASEFAGMDLCDLGAGAREPLLDMIHEYAPDPDVARFRPLAFNALVCLRINDPSAAPDFRPDQEATDSMMELYEHEPSASYRREMQSALRGIDDWTYFLLWERLALSAHPPDPIYYSDLNWPRKCLPPEEPRRHRSYGGRHWSRESVAHWCEHVAPVLQGWLDDGGSRIADPTLVACTLDQRCGGREEVDHE